MIKRNVHKRGQQGPKKKNIWKKERSNEQCECLHATRGTHPKTLIAKKGSPEKRGAPPNAPRNRLAKRLPLASPKPQRPDHRLLLEDRALDIPMASRPCKRSWPGTTKKKRRVRKGDGGAKREKIKLISETTDGGKQGGPKKKKP